jgi:hypothetical protein
MLQDRAGSRPPAAHRRIRVWGKLNAPWGVALAPESIVWLLRGLADLDALAKGIGDGNAWDGLQTLALAVTDRPLAARPL